MQSSLKFVNLTDLFGKQCFGIYSDRQQIFIPTRTDKPQVFTTWEEFHAAVGDIYDLPKIKELCPPWVFGLPSYYVYETVKGSSPVKVAGFYNSQDATTYAKTRGNRFYVIYAGM